MIWNSVNKILNLNWIPNPNTLLLNSDIIRPLSQRQKLVYGSVSNGVPSGRLFTPGKESLLNFWHIVNVITHDLAKNVSELKKQSN
jgi:hypothetical protein